MSGVLDVCFQICQKCFFYGVSKSFVPLSPEYLVLK